MVQAPVLDAPRQPEAVARQPASPAPVRRRQATVQLGVRVPEEVADMVAAEAARRGISQREVVEQAIRSQLG
jgi:predicted HicB family RNase H-like nuclease